MFRIEALPLLEDNYAYLLVEQGGTRAAVVDPGEAAPVMEALRARGLNLETILSTHHHGDHVGGNLELQALTGAQVWGPDDPRIPGLGRALREGEDVELFGMRLCPLHAPGHTRTQHLLHFPQLATLFCGDVLFGLGAGRFFEGTAEDALIGFRKILALADNTQLYWGHEYTLANGAWARSLSAPSAALEAHLEWAFACRREGRPTLPGRLNLERALNPFLSTDSPAEIARLRESRSAFKE